jgi:hypothetical protein
MSIATKSDRLPEAGRHRAPGSAPFSLIPQTLGHDHDHAIADTTAVQRLLASA